MRITSVERKPGRRRLDLHVDGAFALSISPSVYVESGLRAGDDVSPGQLASLRDAQARDDALASALRLLSYRPRSQAELRQRLAAKRIPADLIDETLLRLSAARLVDDAEFARAWVENRERSSPRSRRMLSSELRAKGVRADVAAQSVAGSNDEQAAYRAAERRVRALEKCPYPEFRRRLGGFLLRRGFDYEIVNRTVSGLWHVMNGERRSRE